MITKTQAKQELLGRLDKYKKELSEYKRLRNEVLQKYDVQIAKIQDDINHENRMLSFVTGHSTKNSDWPTGHAFTEAVREFIIKTFGYRKFTREQLREAMDVNPKKYAEKIKCVTKRLEKKGFLKSDREKEGRGEREPLTFWRV